MIKKRRIISSALIIGIAVIGIFFPIIRKIVLPLTLVFLTYAWVEIIICFLILYYRGGRKSFIENLQSECTKETGIKFFSQ